MAIAAAALRVGSMLAKTGGAIAKGGKMAMKKGVTVAKKSKKIAGNVKKAVAKKRKINREIFMSDERTRKKKLEQEKRREEEEALEQTNKSKKKPNPQKTMKKGGGILQKIIDFVSTILIGWVVVNLPKIIDTVKGVIKKIKDIYNNITGFFSSFGEFFNGIKNIVGSTLDKIKDIDFSKVGEKIKEKITGLKDAFTNLIANIGKGLGILKSKKNQDPEKLAKSGFGDGEQNNATKDINDKNSEVDVLKKDTNKFMSDTTGLKDNLNESLKKAESEMSKVDLKIDNKNEKIAEFDREVKDIKSLKKDGSKITIQTLDGKTYKPGDKGYKGELKKAQSAVKDSMKSVTKDSSKFISNIKKADITKSITKEKKSKTIVVDNIIPSTQVTQLPQAQESQAKLIVLGKSLNSMVKENILLNAAYT